jgi:phosphoribosylamine--glycine ligase
VVASGGYPDYFETGKQILGLEVASAQSNVIVFHAASRREKDRIMTAGGRVVGVTALGEGNDLEGTIDAAYSAVQKITFDDMYYRSDVGKKGVLRLRQLAAMEMK